MKLDKVQWGIIGGLIGAFLSFLILFWVTTSLSIRGQAMSLGDFFYVKFLSNKDLTWRILSFSLILDVPLFFLALRYDLERFAKGVLTIFIIMLPIILILYFRGI